MTTSTAEVSERPADAQPDDSRGDTWFVRQPVLDREGMLCGFELRIGYAGPDGLSSDVAPASSASSSSSAAGEAGLPPLVRTLLRPAVRTALAGHRGYVDVDRALLLDPALERVPPQHFLFEIAPDVVLDDALIARIVQLHGRRYRFGLDHVVLADENFAHLLPYVEVVKIDFQRISPALLPKFAKVLKSAGKLLVALGIETRAGFELAANLGFDRFQGYFFADTQVSAGRRPSAPRQALLNLLQLLASEPSVAELEAELKLNPVLVMHLMRLANSGALMSGRHVTTLREAINATGTDRIARWSQLLLYADGRKVALENDPLLQLAATRARFMELAMARLAGASREEADAAFLTGVFSFVGAVFGGDVAGTLDLLSLARPIRAAIVAREGALGLMLTVAEALERAEWQSVDAVREQLAPFSTGELAELALSAAAWAGIAERNAHEGLVQGEPH